VTFGARLFVAALGLLLLAVVLRALRTHRLRYEYSLLWILLGAGLIVLAAFQRAADQVAHWVGIDYPPAFYLLMCVFVILLFLFHLSLRLSVLGDQVKELAQQIALLTVSAASPEGGAAAKSATREAPGIDAGGGSDAGGERR
jgi:hypothetical protein